MDVVRWSNIDWLGLVGGLSPAACLNEMTHHHPRLQLIYYLMAGRSLMSSCVITHSFCACHPLHASWENQYHSFVGPGLCLFYIFCTWMKCCQSLFWAIY